MSAWSWVGLFTLEVPPGGSGDWSSLGTEELGHILRGSDHISSTIDKAAQASVYAFGGEV